MPVPFQGADVQSWFRSLRGKGRQKTHESCDPSATAAPVARASIDAPSLKAAVHDLIVKFDKLTKVRRHRRDGNGPGAAAVAAASGTAADACAGEGGAAAMPSHYADGGDGDLASVSSASTAFYSAAELALEDADAVGDPLEDWADGLVVRTHSAGSLLPSARATAVSYSRGSSRAPGLLPSTSGRRRDGSFVLPPLVAAAGAGPAEGGAGAGLSMTARRGLHPPSKLNALLLSREHTPHNISKRGPWPADALAPKPAPSAPAPAGAVPSAALPVSEAVPAAAGPMALPVMAAEAAAAATADGAAVPASRDEVLVQAADLYLVQGRPGPAFQALRQYCQAAGLPDASLAADLGQRGLPDMSSLAQVVSDLETGLSDLQSDDGWQVVRDSDFKLMYKHDGKLHCFRARCTLDAPTEQITAVVREIDMMPTWNSYCTMSEVLRVRSMIDVAAYIAVWMPWPFEAVGLLVAASGADMYDEQGCLTIAFSTPDSDDPTLPLPAAAAKHRKMRVLRPSCMSLRPVAAKAAGGAQRTETAVEMYVDPGITVPAFIISFVLKVLSPFVFGAVQKLLASAFKAADGPLPSRMRQRRELYGLVQRRTEAYLAAHPTQA
ncbi:hypothetical protein HYH02_007880 [Chlamydomonas schloesseri]|uniref:START domain-containing protein n=1 Tax=Chlamydomonas schloesseri TaxID=2026947 RepID=A0A835WGF0_9CHLO|nr:hypothetical protein HYH02_007880 [Chlamydomonas schloesseri]|eukprot:KAG2447134.1 hypothetical protein HYH02_007880 [Chlamydomonas schloesseri]